MRAPFFSPRRRWIRVAAFGQPRICFVPGPVKQGSIQTKYMKKRTTSPEEIGMNTTERAELHVILCYSRTIATADPETDHLVDSRPGTRPAPPSERLSVLDAIPMGPVPSDCKEEF